MSGSVLFRKALKSQEGVILPMIALVLAIGSVVVFSLVRYTGTAARAGGDDIDYVIGLYAAEAGVNTVIADLIEGEKDVHATSSLIISDLEVRTSVTPTGTATAPTSTYQYIDPGTDAGLMSLASSSTYSFILHNVQAGSRIRVNWAFTSEEEEDWRIKLYKGTNTSTEPLEVNSDTKRPGALLVNSDKIGEGGPYTIVFINESGGPLTSKPFDTDADPDKTWVYVQAHKDYIVTATAGDNTVTAYLRQVPGPTTPLTSQKVYIESWKPYGDR